MNDRLITTGTLMKRINWYPQIRNTVAKELRYVPTVDAVPVVRCKDCKFWEQATEESGRCNRAFYITAYSTDFCSYGEMRNDG